MYGIKIEMKLIDFRRQNKYYLNDGLTKILTWPTLEAAIEYLKERGIDDQIKKQTYQYSGVYVTAWGEYDRPLYHIRKIKHTRNK